LANGFFFFLIDNLTLFFFSFSSLAPLNLPSICAGKAKDPSGLKRKDWGPKKANTGKLMTKRNTKTIEELKKETQEIIDNFPKEKIYDYKKPRKKPYTIVKPDAAMSRGLMCGGEVRGAGAAIKGKGFKGVF